MNWTKLAAGLKGEKRIECDLIPVDGEYGLLIGTHTFALAIPGLKYNLIPKPIEAISKNNNVQSAKKIFDKQNKYERPFALEDTYMSYYPGKSKDAFLIFEGIHSESRQIRTFFIKEKYYKLIPGEVISLHAPEGYGGIMFTSTEAYGYILPYIPEALELTHIQQMTEHLKKMY